MSYSDEVRQLFHNLKLNGYKFDKTDRLTYDETYDKDDDESRHTSYVKAMFTKTNDIEFIYINIEIDTNMIEFSENVEVDTSKNDTGYNYNLEKVKIYINQLLASSTEVRTRTTLNQKEELQNLFHILYHNKYQYNETKPLTRTNVQTVFQSKKYILIVKIEFDPFDITHVYDEANNNDEIYDYNLVDVQNVVKRLLRAPLIARGKGKNQKPKKTKRTNKTKRRQTKKPRRR